MLSKTIALRVPASFEGSRDAATSVGEFLNQLSLRPVHAPRFELVVAESVGNIAGYARCVEDGMVDICVTAGSKTLRIVISDDGMVSDTDGLNNFMSLPEMHDEPSEGGRATQLISAHHGQRRLHARAGPQRSNDVRETRRRRVVSAHLIAGPAGKHAVLRWYPVLDLAPRTDRLLIHFHPTRHESIVDVPHPHPAIPARQRICISDRFADVCNARGKAFSIGPLPADLRAVWTVLRGTKIKFPIPPKQQRNKRIVLKSSLQTLR